MKCVIAAEALTCVKVAASTVTSGLRAFKQWNKRGATNRSLELVAEERIVSLATMALFLEYEEVLKCPE